MTGNMTKTWGMIWARKMLHVGFCVGMAGSVALSSSSALGEQEPPSGAFNKKIFPLLELIDPEKKAIFGRRTPAEPRGELGCLALNTYFEARGEPDEGKEAVAHVVMNRVASERYPDTICDVIQQGGELRRNRCQFSWWCDGRSDKPRNKKEWQKSAELALSVYWGRSDDPTAGALWYHAEYVKPYWRKHFERGPKIGQHIFYRPQGKKTQVASRLSLRR